MVKLYPYAILLMFILGFAAIKLVPTREDIVPESDIRQVATIDECKVYRFKTYDSHKYTDHYFTSCKGSVIDVEENGKLRQIITERK